MGRRGPARDTETDQRILEIVAQLLAWGFHAGHAQVAVSYTHLTLPTN